MRGHLPFIDYFVVATGIEQSFGVLDPVRTRALAEIIHGGKDQASLAPEPADYGAAPTGWGNLSRETLMTKLAGTDSAARSRICFELTVGLYAKMDGSEELLRLLMQETNARQGHGRECEYSPVHCIPADGISFQFNRDAFPFDSPVVAHADNDESPIDDFHMSDSLRYLKTEAAITEYPGYVEARNRTLWGERRPLMRHFFQVLPGGQAPILMKLTGGEFHMEFSWLSDS